MYSGIDRVLKYAHIFENKRIGLFTNSSAYNKNFVSTIDIMHKHFNVVKLFAPEHGIRGELEAGVHAVDYVDDITGLSVISLYGEKRRPTEEMLEDIDILVFDMQDVGSRFYTYLYSMSYCMEACKKYDKKFVVLDRINPINGVEVEGNILNMEFKSFIGALPIVQRHGLTIGECALLFNKEYDINCDLEIIELNGWKREQYYDDTELPFIAPSPNINSIETCLAFCCTCIFEGTNLSEGRGTTFPFQYIGAPYINAPKLTEKLNSLGLCGVKFRPVYFSPTFSKHEKELCSGVALHVTNRNVFKPLKTGLTMLYTIRDMYRDDFAFNPPYREGGKHMIDYNTGNDYVRLGELSLEQVLEKYEEESLLFKEMKSKYHLY